ncbi:MAG: hypothetical protein R3F62_30595 [Planctomycetota bacterium]
MSLCRPTLAVLIGLSVVAVARADDVFRLNANDGSAFSGTLTVGDADAQGQRALRLETEAVSGAATLAAPDLARFRVRLPAAGVTGALQGQDALDLIWFYDAATGQGVASIHRNGTPTFQAAVTPSQDAAADEPSKAGRLVAYTKDGINKLLGKAKSEVKDALQDAIEDGINVRETLRLTDYFHVGLDTGIRAIPADEYTPMQKALKLERPDDVWLANYVEGGARVPLSTSVPLGGQLSFSTGVHARGELRYTIVDLYPKPHGVKDVKGTIEILKAMGRRVYDLPLTADEALGLKLGAERSLEGRWELAVNGQLTYGYDHTLEGTNVEVGASARLGGFYRIRDTMRVEVSRLPASSVRVQVQSIRFKGPGVGARLLVGLDTTNDPLDAGDVEVNEFFVQAADEVFKVEVRASAGKESGSDVDIAYHFDLSKAPARAAYERTIRGDLRLADSLLADRDSGVSLEFRVFEQEEWSYKRGRLILSRLVGGKWSKDVHASDMKIDDESGRHLYNVFRYQKNKKSTFFSKTWNKSLLVDIVRSSELQGDEDPSELSVLKSRRALHYRLVRRDASTYNGEMRRIRRVAAALGLGDPAGLTPQPEFKLFHSRYGKTELRVEVEISEWGIRTIMAKAGDPTLLRDAFAEAYDVVWEIDPRRLNPSDDDLQPREKTGLRHMRSFVHHLQGVRNTGWTAANSDERADHYRELIDMGGWDFVTVVALAKLAPRDCVKVQMDIDGKHMSFNGGFTGERFSSFKPDLHGHLDPLQPGQKGYGETPINADDKFE